MDKHINTLLLLLVLFMYGCSNLVDPEGAIEIRYVEVNSMDDSHSAFTVESMVGIIVIEDTGDEMTSLYGVKWLFTLTKNDTFWVDSVWVTLNLYRGITADSYEELVESCVHYIPPPNKYWKYLDRATGRVYSDSSYTYDDLVEVYTEHGYSYK